MLNVILEKNWVQSSNNSNGTAKAQCCCLKHIINSHKGLIENMSAESVKENKY